MDPARPEAAGQPDPWICDTPRSEWITAFTRKADRALEIFEKRKTLERVQKRIRTIERMIAQDRVRLQDPRQLGNKASTFGSTLSEELRLAKSAHDSMRAGLAGKPDLTNRKIFAIGGGLPSSHWPYGFLGDLTGKEDPNITEGHWYLRGFLSVFQSMHGRSIYDAVVPNGSKWSRYMFAQLVLRTNFFQWSRIAIDPAGFAEPFRKVNVLTKVGMPPDIPTFAERGKDETETETEMWIHGAIDYQVADLDPQSWPFDSFPWTDVDKQSVEFASAYSLSWRFATAAEALSRGEDPSLSPLAVNPPSPY